MTDIFHSAMNLETLRYMRYITADKEQKYPNSELVSSKPRFKTLWHIYVLWGLILLVGPFFRSLRSVILRRYVTLLAVTLTPWIPPPKKDRKITSSLPGNQTDKFHQSKLQDTEVICPPHCSATALLSSLSFIIYLFEWTLIHQRPHN